MSVFTSRLRSDRARLYGTSDIVRTRREHQRAIADTLRSQRDDVKVLSLAHHDELVQREAAQYVNRTLQKMQRYLQKIQNTLDWYGAGAATERYTEIERQLLEKSKQPFRPSTAPSTNRNEDHASVTSTEGFENEIRRMKHDVEWMNRQYTRLQLR